MKLIVGLGNPGKKYENTRHNVGFMVVDALAESLGATFEKKTKQQCWLARTSQDRVPLLLAKPTTYMNLSGQSLRALVNYYQIAVEDLLVVVDDLHLDLGVLRFRARGSAGGQNGLKSIIEHLGTQDFMRLKVGIGSNGPFDAVRHVLGRFSKDEEPIMCAAIEKARDACMFLLAEGLERAMNEYNG